MSAEDILNEPERIAGQMRELAAQIGQLRLSLLPGGLDYSVERVQGGSGSDRVEDVLDRIREREERLEELDARRKWLLRVRLPELLTYIRDPEGRQIVNLYYLYGLRSQEKIGRILHMSTMTVSRKRRAALRDIPNVGKHVNVNHGTV